MVRVTLRCPSTPSKQPLASAANPPPLAHTRTRSAAMPHHHHTNSRKISLPRALSIAAASLATMQHAHPTTTAAAAAAATGSCLSAYLARRVGATRHEGRRSEWNKRSSKHWRFCGVVFTPAHRLSRANRVPVRQSQARCSPYLHAPAGVHNLARSLLSGLRRAGSRAVGAPPASGSAGSVRERVCHGGVQ